MDWHRTNKSAGWISRWLPGFSKWLHGEAGHAAEELRDKADDISRHAKSFHRSQKARVKVRQELSELDALAERFERLAERAGVPIPWGRPKPKTIWANIKSPKAFEKMLGWVQHVTDDLFIARVQMGLEKASKAEEAPKPAATPSPTEEARWDPGDLTLQPEPKQPPYFYAPPQQFYRGRKWPKGDRTKSKAEMTGDLVRAINSNKNLLPPELQRRTNELIREVLKRATQAAQKVAFNLQQIYDVRKADISRIFRDFFGADYAKAKAFEGKVFQDMEQIWDEEFPEYSDWQKKLQPDAPVSPAAEAPKAPSEPITPVSPAAEAPKAPSEPIAPVSPAAEAPKAPSEPIAQPVAEEPSATNQILEDALAEADAAGITDQIRDMMLLKKPADKIARALYDKIPGALMGEKINFVEAVVYGLEQRKPIGVAPGGVGTSAFGDQSAAPQPAGRRPTDVDEFET